MPGALPLSAAEAEARESGVLRPFIILVFTLVAILLNGYALSNSGDPFIRQITQILPHLYYIPIILASVWYPKRGLLLICLVVGVSLGMMVSGLVNGTFNPIILVYAAIYVWVVAIISVFTMEQWGRFARLLPRKKRGQEAAGEGEKTMEQWPAPSEREAAEDVPSLLPMLGMDDIRVRLAAIASLGKTGDRRAIPPLLALLGDEKRGVREAAVRALGGFGEGAVEPLIGGLGNGDWHTRMGCAIALRINGDIRGVEPLIRTLSDENRFVRREAAKSLGRIGDARATEPLISVLDDRDNGVRVRAAAALGKIADPKAIDPLTRAVSDRNSELAEAAVEALSRIRNTVTSSD